MQATSLSEFVSELLTKLGFEGHTVAVREGQRTVVAVSSSDGDRLIGPEGEHLRALNSIARRMVEHQHGEDAASFLVDVNDHHEHKLEGVRSNARTLAQRVRLFKHDVDMPPLSPYERLVVHELFAEDPEIKTESAGEGKFRHIVLKYQSGVTSKV